MSEDEGKNLEENDSQAINHNSLSRNDIAEIISKPVNNDCRVINDFSIIRRGFYFEDFVKAFNKNRNTGKPNHKYCISFVGEYTYFFYISKNITSYTFLLVFTIVENLQCIFNPPLNPMPSEETVEIFAW